MPEKSGQSETLSQRIKSAGIELSEFEELLIADCDNKLEARKAGLVRLDKPMSLGEILSANDTPNPFLPGNQPEKIESKPLA